MPSASTIYRHANPEYGQREKEKTRQYIVKKYNEDPEFRELLKKRALEYYYRKKAEKQSKYTSDDDI